MSEYTEFADCDCGRGRYNIASHSSCYDCFLDRRADYVGCIYCGRWHSPEFDTCFNCRPQGRDEAAHALKLVILARDSFACRYCQAKEGDLQTDRRLIRPKCPAICFAQHNHRWPCKPKCGKRHKCRKDGEPGTCPPGCSVEHDHRLTDDDGNRATVLHIDHIRPCAAGGTADPWNLQTLCGVCNVSKGSDWWPGSRHASARRHMIAAYATYLRDYLTESEQLDLDAELRDLEWGHGDALALAVDDYADRVKACRPRPPAPRAELVIEDLPSEYVHLDRAPIGAKGT